MGNLKNKVLYPRNNLIVSRILYIIPRVQYNESPAGTRVSALFEKQSFLHVLEGLIGFSALKNPHGDAIGNPRGPWSPQINRGWDRGY
jgi:hypothetical protein